jgi:hypothetical protein
VEGFAEIFDLRVEFDGICIRCARTAAVAERTAKTV